MKLKTSTRISTVFSIFTFFIILIILILLNIFSFFGWYNEEKSEIISKMDIEYSDVLDNFNDYKIQEKELLENIEKLGGFIDESNNNYLYKKIFLDLYINNNLFYIIHNNETKFGYIFLPYDVTSYVNVQIRVIKIGVLLLFIFTVLSFVISKFLFTKLALKDIFYISKKLKMIDLNNIEKIEIDLNSKDEIYNIVNQVNHFLDIIDRNTKSLKDFNSQVAHELKTPLMVISSELEFLSLSGDNKESYQKIEKQIDLLNELLETFLFISKIENYRGDIKNDNVDISVIVNEKLEILKEVYKSKNISISLSLDNNTNIISNKKLLKITIKNILDNAFKYNNDGGTIDIEFKNNILTIKDSGLGIKKEDLSKIFYRFYRIEKKVKGYGVGLNIVKKILDLLDYKIEVKTIFGEGTEFKIFFN